MSTTPATATATVETTIQFSVELVTDPVGVELSAEASPQLPDAAAAALMDDVESKLSRQQGNLVFQSIRVANGALRGYATRNEYEMEPIAESVELLDTSRSDRRFSARWGWTHEAAIYFNFGVAPHTINGNPLLHFYWEEIGQWIKTESVEWGSRTGGIPESRYVQAGINWLRQELQ
jgi:hypothetical protein